MSFEDDDDFDAESVQKWRTHYSKRVGIRSPSSRTTKHKSKPNPGKKRTSGQKFDTHRFGDDMVSNDYVRRKQYVVHDRMEISPSCNGKLFGTNSKSDYDFKMCDTTSTKSVGPDCAAAYSSDKVNKLHSVVSDGAVDFDIETEDQLSVDTDSKSRDSTAPSERHDAKFGTLTAYSDTSIPLQCPTWEVEKRNSDTTSLDVWVSTGEGSSILSCKPYRHVDVVQFGGRDESALSRTCSALSTAGGSSQSSSLPCAVVSGTTGSTPGSNKVLHTTSKRRYEGTYPCSAPQKKQASLLSFLVSGRGGVKRMELDCPTTSRRISKSTNKSPYSRATGHEQMPSPHLHVASYPTSQHRSRSCPFYKRIPGTSVAVDAFQYGSIPGCSAYFLSHFHSDHYQGLNRHFKLTIYCTQVTANLVKQRLKVPAQYVHQLPLNEPNVIDGVEVILLDANHCPGSVMFLFKLPSGRNYLHTGDFRFTQAMVEYPQLASSTIHQLFLDTTYCSPQYDFPNQEDVIQFAVQKALAAIRTNPRTLIVCGTYTIGKEKVFIAIADALGSKVCVGKDKKAVLDCLESERLTQMVTTDPRLASVHVLPIGRLTTEGLSAYLDAWKPEYSAVLAFKPTGWTHSTKLLSLASIRPQGRGPVTLYGIPYSEHSSFSELCRFVQFLKPQKIIPTVNNHSASKREEMQRHFRRWLSESSTSVPASQQTTLDCVFNKT